MVVSKDTVTFRLSGELTLEDYARAVRRFADLVAALRREGKGGDKLEWFLAGLGFGNGTATVQARLSPKKKAA